MHRKLVESSKLNSCKQTYKNMKQLPENRNHKLTGPKVLPFEKVLPLIIWFAALSMYASLFGKTINFKVSLTSTRTILCTELDTEF